MYGGSSSPTRQAAGQEMEAILSEMRDAFQPVRGADGRMGAQLLNGEKYRYFKDRIKEVADSTYDTNRTTYNGMKMLENVLDEGMENGIRNYGGETSARAWKDYNERYALTKLLIDKGTNPETLQFDPKMLRQNLMSKDRNRMILEQGNRVVPLFKMAKIQGLVDDATKSTLAGHNMKGFSNSGRVPLWHKLLQMPVAGRVPVVPRAYMKMYEAGWPSKTGLLNMGEGGLPEKLVGKFWDHPSLYTRAAYMGTPWQPTDLVGQATDYAGEKYDQASDAAIGFTDWVQRQFE